MDLKTYQQKCKDDPLWFIESHLWIAPKAGGLVKFVLNDEQLEVLKRMEEMRAQNRPIRAIILKSRRLGISTMIEGLGYHLCSTREHTNGLVLSHDMDSARKIFKITHRFVNNDERLKVKGLMPGVSKANRGELEFDNPDWRARGESPGLGSSLTVATADNKKAGRGDTLQFLHCSEVAFWKDSELAASMLEALSDLPNTIGILESTANGRNGYFYHTWKNAERDPDGYWLPIFLSWKGRPECTADLSKQQRERFLDQMTEAELKLQKEHGLSVGEMAWRRRKIQSYEGTGIAPEDLFRQEYPLTSEEAFIGTGRQYFDMRAAEKYEHAAHGVPYEEGWIELVQPIVKNRPSGVRWHPRRPLDGHNSFTRIWKHPEAGCDYVVGADVAMGMSAGDWSVAYVLKRETREFVAKIKGKIEPDLFADMLVELAWYYNEAFLCPENNSIGMSVAKKTSGKYTRHAYVVKLDKPWNPSYDLDRPGWNTNNSNRREMFAYLRQLFRDEQIHIWDEDFLAEVTDFVVPEEAGRIREDKPRAVQHKHDDHIAAAAITLQADSPIMAGPIRRPKSMPVNSEDWRVQALDADIRKETAASGKVLDEHLGALI